jgi:hypothetical protein
VAATSKLKKVQEWKRRAELRPGQKEEMATAGSSPRDLSAESRQGVGPGKYFLSKSHRTFNECTIKFDK